MIRWWGRLPVRLGRPKHIVRVCWDHLAEEPVRMVFNLNFDSFDHIPEVVGDMELPRQLFRTVVARLLVLLMAVTPEPADEYQR